MGIYLNPGPGRFQMAVNSEIFVDKTEMISCVNAVVNTNQRFLSVSRPRRFGKTMAADMLCAYYGMGAESRGLFEQLKIGGSGPDWDMYLGSFDVIHLVMTDFLEEAGSVEAMLSYLTEEVSAELREAYPAVRYGERMNLRTVMSRIYAGEKRQFVVVIDEWDAIFREYKADQEGQKRYLDFLRDWLKDKEYIALAYMTGILPIKKYGKHSALNMFDEYSMVQPMQLAPFSGFTEEEVEGLCGKYEMSYKEISSWYDGYQISDWIPVNKRRQYRRGEYEEHRLRI